MEPRDVVVVGGSAGSLAPLRELTAALTCDSGTIATTLFRDKVEQLKS